MADYIKKEDAARKIARANAHDLCAEYGQHFSLDKVNFESEMENALKFLADIPSADVAPVRHAHWIKISPAGIYECSECGKNVMTSDIKAYEYCHGCGAKMDEGESDGTDDR